MHQYQTLIATLPPDVAERLTKSQRDGGWRIVVHHTHDCHSLTGAQDLREIKSVKPKN